MDYFPGVGSLEEYKKIKNFELLNKAQEEFSQALVRNPYSSKIHMIQGDTFSFQGKKENAKHSYKRAMKDPRYALPALARIRNLRKHNEGVGP